MSKGNRKRRKALAGQLERRRCSARTSSGNPCQASPIVGGNVCWHHGGAAPQVRQKAEERLRAGVDDMLTQLWRLATSETVGDNVRLAAVRDWLDRAGITVKHDITVEAKWHQVFEDIIAEVPDEWLDANRPADVVAGEVVRQALEAGQP